MHSHSKKLPTNLGCYCRVGQLSRGVPSPFLPFQSLFKLPKVSLIFLFTPALRAHSDQFMSTLACVAKELKFYFRLLTSSRVRKTRTTQVPSTRIRIFSNPQLFLPDSATVHTYPANSTANPEKNKSALQSGKKYIRNESDNVWTGESGYFLSQQKGVLANHEGDGNWKDTTQKV